ncbi:hypothetical protein UPYG_G00287850 [Umbra pygmaea]|uniref:Uncharacterized protein n=1 Tax=Umbra pygmaea TaxID=75934 RepID=A0ABD0W8I9_UMBPY
MQPPHRTASPGASCPPSASGGPNNFRRQRSHKNTGVMAMVGQPPPAQPLTDPFAFGRQVATSPMAGAPSSSPLPTQNPSASTYLQAGMGQGQQQTQPLDSAQAAFTPLGPPQSSTPEVCLFTPNSAMGCVPFPGQLPAPPSHAPHSAEEGYFNSSEPAPSITQRPRPMSSAPVPGQGPYSQDYRGEPNPQAIPFQPVPGASPLWAHNPRSCPPSVQNYFQPTSDPPPQAYHGPSQIPPHMPFLHLVSPLHTQQQAQPQQQSQLSPQLPDGPPNSQCSRPLGANALQQHNSHFQNQGYLSQSSAPQEPWFNQPNQAYHQMGAGPSRTRPDSSGSQYWPDSAGSHQGFNCGSATAPVPDGTISMFFKGNDVENEETLAGEGGRSVNGLQALQPSHNQVMTSSLLYAHPVAGAEAPQFDHAPFQKVDQLLPYMANANFPGTGILTQQDPAEAQFDHVENLECVPNQEVLPSEPQCSPAAAAAHAGDRYEAGPNLETPDSVPRPIRSASVCSSYSNVSHCSSTSTRRHQGVVGTFIQQESLQPSDDTHSTATALGYFEQIDTSPSGNAAAACQHISGRVYHSQTPTPSPPKPTGVFQASANSSFEPVCSHSVGVRPVEVDRARMVVESCSDLMAGNLEQPPDNVENVYVAAAVDSHAGIGVPPLGYPMSHSLSRPSSRAHVAHRPCESPATTLWAQQDPTSLGANILLAPAAPLVLAPLREPSAEVIQPPEDGPLDLQPPHRAPPPSHEPTENQENPPKVSEGELSNSQSSVGYASLLVSESLYQPVLIAPPISSDSVIPTINPALATYQNQYQPIAPRESNLSVISPPQFQGSDAAQPGSIKSTNQNLLFAHALVSFSSASSQSPINLARDVREEVRPEIKTPSSHSQAARLPLSQGQSMGGDSHSSLPVNSQSDPAAALSHAPAALNHTEQSNYELLDFSMHQSKITNQTGGQPPPSLQQGLPLASNAPGFYLQITKDAQQGARGTVAPPQGQPGAHPFPAHPLRPPSSLGSEQGYVPPPPPPGQIFGGYYGGAYPEYTDGRAPYPPAPYPPASVDLRAQQYYQDDPYRKADPRYSRYDGANPAYPPYREHQPERPSSRTSQNSNRPNSRQGLSPEDYQRAKRSAYDDYYAEHYKNQYGERSRWDTCNTAAGAYDPRYRDYYDQNYWYNYNPEAYRGREAAYYNQQPAQLYPAGHARTQGYDDQWRYYPGYDTSFDDDYLRQRNPYGDDFDRRSAHSEQSAHSLHSSHSHHSRRSSFSSHSQQSQVYRSQPDLTAVYNPTVSTLPLDYSYGQFPEHNEPGQSFSQYSFPSGYQAKNSIWVAAEQPPPRPVTPEKFSVPHRCARFGSGGHLIEVLPNLPSAGQPALVEIHNVETMLQDTQEQSELRSFPGPLLK